MSALGDLTLPPLSGPAGSVQPPPAVPPSPAAPAAVPTPLPGVPAIPTPDPSAELDLPKIDPADPFVPDTGASTWDVMGAAWRAQDITGDVNGQSVMRRARIVDDMFQALPPDARHRITIALDDRSRRPDMEALVFGEAAAARAKDPGSWAAFPANPDDLATRVAQSQKADLDEAQAILDQPGGGVSEFLGGMARDATSAPSLLMLPLGGFEGLGAKLVGKEMVAGAGGVGVKMFGVRPLLDAEGREIVTAAAKGHGLKIFGSEMALGALGNVANLPSEKRVAAEMGLPEPSFWGRAVEGALMGGAFAAVGLGVAKALTMWHARHDALKAAVPKGADPLQAELSVDAAEGALRGEQTPQERVAGQGNPGQPPTFDFTARGNASPTTNRIGYVYGRLIERGMPPDVAAGFVGNFMVESTPSLNPAALGDGGRAHGIAQWNDRADDLKAFAAQRGKDWRDLDTQIDFIFHELNGKEADAAARIFAAKSPEEAALAVSKFFERPGIPHNEQRVAFARSVAAQYAEGRVPKWEGAALAPDGPTPPIATSRGYTRDGQVTAGDYRVNVRYEVVDAATLRPASADLQPRDRTTVASDAQIARIAAELDPLRLMPSPEAQNGAPIVGMDNIVESGNGRVAALNRAAELHPDRAATYRQALVDAGYDVPPEMKRPVLIARRVDELPHAERVNFVAAANVAQVARMSPVEMARVTGRQLDAATVRAVDWTKPLSHPDNAAGARGIFAHIPAEERGAMVNKAGQITPQGEKTIRAAVFAAAWDDPTILDLFLAGEKGELKSLMQAMERAAPAWAAMRADAKAGLIRAELDITPFVEDAMQLIAEARRLTDELAGSTTPGIEAALDELLTRNDLLEGVASPLTAALVRRFWQKGKAARADDIADFLTRYADEARKVGGTEARLFDMGTPGPREVLQAVDPDHFSDLPQDLGQPRSRPEARVLPEVEPTVDGFDQGAASPEAVAADEMAAADLVPEKPADKPKADAQPPRSQTFTPAAPRPDPMAELHRQFADLSIEMADGTQMTAREIIDDLKADEGFDAFIQACALPTGGAQ